MNSVFGKYSPYNTIIHRLDPRIKMFGLIAIMVLCFLPYGNYANRFIILGVLSLIIITTMILGKVSFLEFLKNLKTLWFMMVFLLIIFVFIPQNVDVESLHPIIPNPGGYQVYWEGLFQTLHVFLRLVMMIALTMILTSTTTPMEITFALEWYMKPLKLIKFPTQIISMTLSLALRFIPTLLDETHKIMKAQKSRGVDYNKGFLVKKIKSVTTLIVPLLVSCFSKSDELSLAMDARGYDPYGKRSSYKVYKTRTRDYVSLIIILLLMAGFITLSCFTIYYNGFDNLFKLIFGVEAF